MGDSVMLHNTISLRSRKSRIVLNSVAQKKPVEMSEKETESFNTNKIDTFSCLNFLWQQKYISSDDYLTACKYVELYQVICRIQGYPKGFGRKVAWYNPFKTSRLGWIQSELSLLDQDYLGNCSDDEVLQLWRALQLFFNKMPLSYRVKFNELMFEEKILNFHHKERLYLKAFQHAIPAIKAFMVAFWKQKKP